jgi:excisionase family DNA binding protein
MPENTNVSPEHPRRYRDYDDAAAYTCLSKRTLEGLVSQSRLRAIRIGKRVVFETKDLDNLMARAKR